MNAIGYTRMPGFRRLYALLAILCVAAPFRARAAGTDRFPLCRELAGGRELPLPTGCGVSLYYQTQDYDLTRLDASIPGVSLADTAGVTIENRTMEANAKLDLWLLPFLNLYALAGYIEGETSVDLGLLAGELDVDYTGIVYGGGGVLAAGTDRFFAALNTTFVLTKLDTSDSSLQSWIIQPQLGTRTPRAAFWAGAMYQQTEESHEGRIALPGFGTVDYDVEFEQKEPWSYLIGTQLTPGKAWAFDFELGFGTRQHVLTGATRRF